MTTALSWLPDVGLFNAILLLLSVFGWLVLVLGVKSLWRFYRGSEAFKLIDITSMMGATLMIAVLNYAAYSNTRRAHWLRVGTARYTVATVTRSYYSRSGRKFVFVYRVGPYQGKSQQDCGEAGCPPVGSRRYVRFAAEAPDVSELTRWDVPDSLQTVPPLGWAELP